MSVRDVALRRFWEAIDQKIAEEGDRFEWESSGYACLIKRTPRSGALCGHVSVPAEHPWHGLNAQSRVTPIDHASELQLSDAATPTVSTFLNALAPRTRDGGIDLDMTLRVHGGVTWSSVRGDLLGEQGEAWTFGFDCSHADDVMPALQRNWPFHLVCQGTYRDRDYVFGETSRMAAQLRIVQERGFR